MVSFGESRRLPALGSEELRVLCQKLEQQVPKVALTHVAPASAQPRLTDNSAAAFSSSGCARLDLFFKCEAKQHPRFNSASESSTADAADQGLEQLLAQAWQEDPLDTLKLIAHMRDVRDGKGEQKQFYTCIKWLAKQHPLTLAANLSLFSQVGYWKDLPEVLLRMCTTPRQLQQQKDQVKSRKRGREGGVAKGSYVPLYKATKDPANVELLQTMRKKDFRKHLRSLNTHAQKEEARAQRAKQAARKREILQEAVKQLRDSKKNARKEAVEKLYAEDTTFQLLHVTVAMLFAEQLQKDLEASKGGKASDVSLAAKWAPTPGKAHDQSTWIGSSIAELLFPGKEHQQAGQSYSDYINHVRGLYHKTVLVPLRKSLDIAEVYMSAKAWGDVNYPRVPSVCMRNNKGKFEKHDKERFQQYLDDVKSGKKKIASGALKPHELVREAMTLAGSRYAPYQAMYDPFADEMDSDENSDDGMDVEEGQVQPPDAAHGDAKQSGPEEQRALMQQAEKKRKEEGDAQQQTMELQWKSYVTNLKKSGTLSSALAVCDVSGSMIGEPMEVAIALGLLTAEVTAAPFNNLVCTFSESPVLHHIKGESLVEKVANLRAMQWGGSTDLNKTFDLILERACVHNIAPEDMVQTLFIFSDMQFDMATRGYHGVYGGPLGYDGHPRAGQQQTNFHAAQHAFEKEGYKLPKVVFWNLEGDGSGPTPVTENEQGAALISGFSGQMLKLFMGGASELEKFSPFNVMKEAISAEKYDAWKIVD